MTQIQVKNIQNHWNTKYGDGKYSGQGIATEVMQFLEKHVFPNNPNKGNMKILEIGCGNGRNLIPIAKMGFEAFGIDLSDVGLQQALKTSKNTINTLNLRHGNFSRLPYNNYYFDVVIAFNVLQHGSFHDCQLAISQVARVLKKGGMCFVSVRSAKRQIPKDAIIHHDNSNHGISFISETDKPGIILHHWHETEIKFVAKENGLEIVSKEEYSKGISDNGIEKWHWNIVLKKK